MPNNPFVNQKFSSGPPSTAPWETGPMLYPPRYNGQTQTAVINVAKPAPPMETGPIAAVGMSQIFST